MRHGTKDTHVIFFTRWLHFGKKHDSLIFQFFIYIFFILVHCCLLFNFFSILLFKNILHRSSFRFFAHFCVFLICFVFSFLSIVSHGWNFAILDVLRTWRRQELIMKYLNLHTKNVDEYMHHAYILYIIWHMFHRYILYLIWFVVSLRINFWKILWCGIELQKQQKHEVWQQSESDKLQK